MNYVDGFRVTGRTAVVTGGAGGIGAACVDALLDGGAKQVVIVDFSKANLDAARKRLAGKPVSFEQVDVTNPTAVKALAAKLQPVDILVNNAGIGRQTAAESIGEEEWHEVMNVNMNAVFWCAQAFGKYMIERQQGTIVNIGSMAGEIVVRPQKNVHYNASKAGVHHITKSLAAEWAPYGVNVNAVAPGFIETPMNAFALQSDVETTNMWLGNTPRGRVGTPEEVAAIVLFLASGASRLMNGAIVLADGGYTVW